MQDVLASTKAISGACSSNFKVILMTASAHSVFVDMVVKGIIILEEMMFLFTLYGYSPYWIQLVLTLVLGSGMEFKYRVTLKLTKYVHLLFKFIDFLLRQF